MSTLFLLHGKFDSLHRKHFYASLDRSVFENVEFLQSVSAFFLEEESMEKQHRVRSLGLNLQTSLDRATFNFWPNSFLEYSWKY